MSTEQAPLDAPLGTVVEPHTFFNRTTEQPTYPASSLEGVVEPQTTGGTTEHPTHPASPAETPVELQTSSSGGGTANARDAAEPDDRICRICFGGPPSNEAEEKELGRLISPCRCKGTMKFVHVECLNEWRRVSRKKESYYECDHCRYRYNIERTRWSKLVVNEAVVTLLTLLIFFLVTILAGFVMKLLAILYGPYLDEENAEIFLFLNPSSFSLWRVDVAHIYSGVVVIGLLGFFQAVLTFMTGPWGGIPRFRTAANRDRGPSIVIMVLVVIGVLRTLIAIYMRVKKWSRSRLEMVEAAILEVQ